jgi:3-oxoacyl-(acyl-carrier-protein) synthase
MIAGGAEELDVTDSAVFDTLYATSTKNDQPATPPCPFDRDRDGLVIGEDAGTLILEELEHARARGAPILAEIVGFACNSDGSHVDPAASCHDGGRHAPGAGRCRPAARGNRLRVRTRHGDRMGRCRGKPSHAGGFRFRYADSFAEGAFRAHAWRVRRH